MTELPNPAGGDGSLDTIAMYNADGTEARRVPRDEYRNRWLPRILAGKWNDADDLFQTVVVCINDGFADQLSAAVDRLAEIDGNSARAAILQSVVRTRLGHLDDAELALQNYLDSNGPEATVLTNLATVYSARGDQQTADRLLWDTLQLDPNEDNALQWWALRRRDESGELGYIEALRRVERELGGWLAPLLLGRHAIRNGDPATAIELFRRVIALDADQSHVLLTISGDLGMAGRSDVVLELVLPRFDPDHHDPNIGLNLIAALQRSGRTEEGKELLTRLRPHTTVTMQERLRLIEARLDGTTGS